MIELIAIVAWASTATAVPSVELGLRRARRDEAEVAAVAVEWSRYFDWLGDAVAAAQAARLGTVRGPAPGERVAA